MRVTFPTLNAKQSVTISELLAYGDKKAFCRFYDQHCSRVYKMLVQLGHFDSTTAEELTVTIFIDLWQHRSVFLYIKENFLLLRVTFYFIFKELFKQQNLQQIDLLRSAISMHPRYYRFPYSTRRLPANQRVLKP